MIRVDRWVPSDNLKLEPNALVAATEIERNLALTAGPGAGKTEMLAQRADFLLRTGTCRYPKRIRGLGSETPAGFRPRRGFGHDPAPVSPHNAPFPSYKIARNAIRQTYSHVFLDEFQDCTNEQYKLITACFLDTDANLVAVGDTKQRIMGWAGALEGIFETYAVDFNAKPLNLYQNFRSAPRLRLMQNAMVRVMDAPAALDEKELQGDDGEIDILRFKEATEEASYLANAIAGWIENQTIEPSDIAVLVSKQQNLYCQQLRAALRAREVPFREEDQTQDIASEAVARLITDFLLVVSGSAQPEAYRRLLETVIYNEGLDDEQEYRARSRWDRVVTDLRHRVSTKQLKLGDRNDVTKVGRTHWRGRTRRRSSPFSGLRAGQ
jgi:superfamily I DNA/RNA helicase